MVSPRKVMVTVLAVIGFGSMLSSFALYQHLLHVSPTKPRDLTKQTYELNEHGHLFYVTETQYYLFHCLLFGGGVVFVIAAILNQEWKALRDS